MPQDFYKADEYKELQSKIMKENWKKGLFDFIRKKKKRVCKRGGCGKVFEAQPSDPKIYCSHSCSAMASNAKRGPMSAEQKLKISAALIGEKYPTRQHQILAPRVQAICANPKCGKVFTFERWMKRKYCSVKCHMAITGGRPTSPKAARGKAGIRKDIDEKIYFYSRWEANYARLLNYLRIKWQYQPKTFDLKSQHYTPDFYLIETDTFVEVKNFPRPKN